MDGITVAVEAIRRITNLQPSTGIILGSGLGGVVEEIEDALEIDFAAIPGFQVTTADGHAGKLVFGRLQGRPVVAMAGRLHRYGGWCVAQVTFPVRVLAALGAERLIVSNAAGGLNPNLAVGDIVLIEDHIDWMYGHPTLRFTGGEANGAPLSLHNATSRPLERREVQSLPEVPFLSRTESLYDRAMIAEAQAAARRADFAVCCGTYLATLGPNYETRAEYRMMRRIGADVVGMSTVPEVLAASQAGMRVLALSMVSNVARPDAPLKADHEEVLQAGQIAAPKLSSIVRAVTASERRSGNVGAARK